MRKKEVWGSEPKDIVDKKSGANCVEDRSKARTTPEM